MEHDCIIARDLSWIKCLKCGRTSHNQNDVYAAYCGYCHEFRSSGIMEDTGKPQCDFCSGETETPVWEYPAQSFDTGERYGRIIPESTGSWFACENCAALVEQGDREGLVKRALELFAKAHPEADGYAQFAPDVKRLHDSFFEARTDHVRRLRLT